MDDSVKPRLRGVSHQYAFFLSLVAGAVLVALASSEREIVATAVFAGTLAVMFGVSALYHRPTWPRVVAPSDGTDRRYTGVVI